MEQKPQDPLTRPEASLHTASPGRDAVEATEAAGGSAATGTPPGGPLKTLEAVIARVPEGGRVLDVGCHGWKLVAAAQAAGRGDLRHSGCDLTDDEPPPPSAELRIADLRVDALPWEDDSFDLVVLSHVLEHLTDPVAVFGEAVRVCRPGGMIYVEGPSDRSTAFSFPFAQKLHLILSFWDDPTHVGRPLTPQSLYRLGVYWHCRPLTSRYDHGPLDLLLFLPRLAQGLWRRDPDQVVYAWWKLVGWTCIGVFLKPAGVKGKPRMRYFSFKGVRHTDLTFGTGR